MYDNLQRNFRCGYQYSNLSCRCIRGTYFISFLISLFKYIPKLEAALSKKDKKTELAENAVVNTVSQIEVKEEEEELSDDLELVAVITAAIAASAGTSTDGFVVRSIRRSNNSRWAK